jgi:hypothetical protein
MALPSLHPLLKEQTVQAFTVSCATSPIAAVARASFRGTLRKVGLVVTAAFTTDMSVAVAIKGTAVGGSPFTVTAASSALGTTASLVCTSPCEVNEDDIVSFTPSGSTGTAVAAACFAVIKAT